MKERDLIRKLNDLRAIAPAADWKARNREVMLAQIAGTKTESAASWFEVFENFLPERLVFVFSKPVAVFAAVALVVAGGSLFSVRAAAGTKPGDSLYIAKIISEKTQLALTFDSRAKAQLNLEFATNRAEEANQVMTAPASDQQKSAQIAELSTSFKKELTAVKSRLAKINPDDNNNPNNNTDDEKIQVFGSALEKSNQGLDVSINQPDTNKVATATNKEGGAAFLNPTEQALNDAEKLFDQKDYSGSLNKIKEVSALIDKDGVAPSVNSGQAAATSSVPGISGTSTEKRTNATSTK